MVEKLHEVVVVVIVYDHKRVPEAVEVDLLSLDTALADLAEELGLGTMGQRLEVHVLVSLPHAEHAEDRLTAVICAETDAAQLDLVIVLAQPRITSSSKYGFKIAELFSVVSITKRPLVRSTMITFSI